MNPKLPHALRILGRILTQQQSKKQLVILCQSALGQGYKRIQRITQCVDNSINSLVYQLNSLHRAQAPEQFMLNFIFQH